ncbi:hypothetical protein LguiA_030450 [Lonicera macranthoides]
MMKGQRTSVVLFIALITIIVGIDSNNNKNGGGSRIFVGALTEAQCGAERDDLVQDCKSVVARMPPSPLCCQRIRGAHIECVCPVITPKLAPFIDIDYAVRVIQGCGRRVPRHYKCGMQKKPSSKATYRKKVVLIVSKNIGLLRCTLRLRKLSTVARSLDLIYITITLVFS